MGDPDLQRLSLIAVDGPLEETKSRIEAIEVDLGIGSGIAGDELIDRALQIVAPRYYRFEETRSQQNWGATGLQSQDIEILFAIGVGVELTAAAVITSLKEIGKVVSGRRRVESADVASTKFEQFVKDHFRVTTLRIDAVDERAEDWSVVASSDIHKFAGVVTKDGRVTQAKRQNLETPSHLESREASSSAESLPPKVIELILPTGKSETVVLQPGTSAQEVTSRFDITGFVILTADGRYVYPEEDLYSAVESGQILSLDSSPTGGKGGVEVPNTVTDVELWRVAFRYQLIYSLAGLLLGLACVLGGVILVFHGLGGSTGWVAELVGAKSTLTDAPPGVVLFVVGLLVVVATGFRIKAGPGKS
jgi:hypothetical protein